jgi:RNA polymerase sigma-70 factor (ECF subfamily)
VNLDRSDQDRAFDALFHREHAGILRAVHLVVGDVEVARELTQEAFTRLYVDWPRLAGYDRPGAWVRRVALRLAIRSQRRHRRLGDLLSRPTVEREARSSEMLDVDIVAALRVLPAQQRAAVVLTYLEDLPAADVADAIGCSESTVRVHLHRARARLADLLSAEREDITDAT